MRKAKAKTAAPSAAVVPVSVPISSRWRGLAIGVAGAAVLAGALLRVRGLFTELWLDEVWSLTAVRRLSSPSQLLTRYLQENNHLLNSLVLWLLRSSDSAPLLRFHSLLAGLAAVGLAYLVGRRRDELTGLTTASLFALSYPLVHYSSEARGYALAILFALGAYLSLWRYDRDASPRAALAFGLCAALGFLSQPITVHLWAGSLAYTAVRMLSLPARDRWRWAARLQLGPACFFALYYFGFVTRLQGDANTMSAAATTSLTAAALLGVPMREPWATAALLAALPLLAAALLRMRRAGETLWVFLAVVTVLSPLAVVIVMKYPYLMVRHLLLSIVFGLVLLGRLLADALRAGAAARAAGLALLALFAAGNVRATLEFLREGRGHYRQAVQRIADESAARVVLVGGDHDFRDGLMVRYYARLLRSGARVQYVPLEQWPPGGPEWVIVHSLEPDTAPLPSVTPAEIPYKLHATYRHAGLSGITWFLYKRG